MAGLEAMACSMACWFRVVAMCLPCLRAKRSFSTGKRLDYVARLEAVLVGGVFCCGKTVVSNEAQN